MEDSKFSEPVRNDNSARYFGMGVLFLFLLALVWSVDASFVYFSLAGAVFFFYLGFRKRPSNAETAEDTEPTSTPRSTAQQRDFSVPDFFQALHQKRKKSSTAQPSRKPFTLRGVMVVVVWLVFAAVMWLVLFAGWDNDYTDEAFYHYQQGQNYYYNGQYDSALLSYRQALKNSPEYGDALAGYGNMLLANNQRDSALIMFDKALEINPEHETAQYYKAWFYYTSQEYPRALEIITPLVHQNPEYYDAVELKGSILYGLQKNDEALPLFEIAYAAGNRSQWLCHVMAYLYDIRKDTSKAIELYKEALTYDDTTLSIYQRLGELIPGEEGNDYRTTAARLQQGN